MVIRIPRRSALCANSFNHIFEILADRDLLVWFGFRGDLEAIGKNVMLRIVVNDLDAALFVIVERSENRLVTAHSGTSLAVFRPTRYHESGGRWFAKIR